MGKLISSDYKDQLKQLHVKNDVWGSMPSFAIFDVCDFIRHYDVWGKSILDYGSGKGGLSKALGNGQLLDFINYDPAVPEFSEPVDPPCEFGVCLDVMEHVEEEFVENVLLDISKRVVKCTYFNIALFPAKTILPDGRNAHITLKTAHEWINILDKYFELEKCEVSKFKRTGLPRSLKYYGLSKYWIEKSDCDPCLKRAQLRASKKTPRTDRW